MASDFHDAEFPAEPYPGTRPACSFVHVEGGIGHPLRRVGGHWRLADGTDLGTWLAARGAPPVASRRPVLAYGSNACPSKITWLRSAHGLIGPVVVLRADVRGLAAVWAAGFRVVDDQRPATLCADDDAVARERHAVWQASDDQLAALDRCEGRGERYDLAELQTGEVRLEGGEVLDRVIAYVGRSEARMPLLVDGSPVRCADVGQSQARHLRGHPAADDGIVRRVLTGPHATGTTRSRPVG